MSVIKIASIGESIWAVEVRFMTKKGGLRVNKFPVKGTMHAAIEAAEKTERFMKGRKAS